MDLEALRLQALQTLKNGKSSASTSPTTTETTPPEPNKEDGELSDVDYENIAHEPWPAEFSKREIPKMSRKERKGRWMGGVYRPAPSSVLSLFTNKVFQEFSEHPSEVQLSSGPPPPKPFSFSVPISPILKEDHQPAIISYSAHPVSSNRYVIDLDSSSEDEPQAERASTQSKIESSNRDQIEKRIAALQSQMRALDESFTANENLIKSAVEKQTALKRRAKQYKHLISKGKFVKIQLSNKKAKILHELYIANQTLASEIPLNSGCNDVPKPKVAHFDPNNQVLEDSRQDVSANSSKRKAEMEELEKQLDKVQKELEQSKLGLIKSQGMKKQKLDKTSKKVQSMMKSFDELLRESRDIEIETTITSNHFDRLVEIDKHLYPLSEIVKIWQWIKMKLQITDLGSDKEHTASVSTSNEYKSPLEWFKSVIFSPFFLELVPRNGLLSLRYFNKIDPMLPFCRNEFEFGCTEKDCPFQHFKQITLTEDEVVQRIIQGLLDFAPNSRFDSKRDFLEFIQQKMSENQLRGLPIVSLASKLLDLRSEITDETWSISQIQRRNFSWKHTESMNSAKMKVKMQEFMNSMEKIPKRLVLLSCCDRRIEKRYYAESTDFHSRDDTGNHWLRFIDANSFEQSCSLILGKLPQAEDSREITILVLALAKRAIDAHRFGEAKAIFLATLHSQMSIQFDDVVPCAQLCALPIELTTLDKAHLWIFYLGFLNSESYSPDAFGIYPHDFLYNFQSWPLIEWKFKDSFIEAELALDSLIRELSAQAELEKEWLVHNRLNLATTQNKPLDYLEELGDSFALRLSAEKDLIPSEKFYSTWSPFSSLLNCIALETHDLKALSRKCFQETLQVDDMQGEMGNLLYFIEMGLLPATEAIDIKSQRISSIGAAVLKDDLTVVQSIENLDHYPKMLSDMITFPRVKTSLGCRKGPLELETILEQLIEDPSNCFLWKSLYADLHSNGFEKYISRIKEVEAKFCPTV